MQICNIKQNNYFFYGYQTNPVNFRQKKEPEITLDHHLITNIKFPEPISLKEVSEFLMKPEVHDNLHFFNLYDRNIEALGTSKLANVKIKEFLGNGTRACAFLMDNDRVLKLTRGQHLMRRPEKFDIPIYDQGILLWDKPDNIHYYIEEYGDPKKVSEKEARDLINEIKASGHEVIDIYTDLSMKNIFLNQFGKAADGKVYLLDPECVEY